MTTPLLNGNIESNLKELQNEYFNFSKNLGELKKYNEKIAVCSKNKEQTDTWIIIIEITIVWNHLLKVFIFVYLSTLKKPSSLHMT